VTVVPEVQWCMNEHRIEDPSPLLPDSAEERELARVVSEFMASDSFALLYQQGICINGIGIPYDVNARTFYIEVHVSPRQVVPPDEVRAMLPLSGDVRVRFDEVRQL
jgi:hypothetical protein